MPPFAFDDIERALGLGRDAAALTFMQISLRGIVVFVATLAIIRCGDRRFLPQKTALMPCYDLSSHRCSRAR